MVKAGYGACVVEEKARDSRKGIFKAESHCGLIFSSFNCCTWIRCQLLKSSFFRKPVHGIIIFRYQYVSAISLYV
jgi:hypothetical protein